MNVGVDNRAKAINQIFVGVNNIAKLVYSSSGGSGSFELPTFTGNNAVFGDELSGRIELYESGTLTLSPGTYDFFLVGGGGGGGAYYSSTSDDREARGGGAGGYTINGQLVVDRGMSFEITVGAGGTAGGRSVNATAGGLTSFVEYDATPHTANGGGAAAGSYEISGGSGGSGGGGGGEGISTGRAGGSDGGAGVSGGSGQGTTTRAFGEPEATLYAGGGASGARQNSGTGGAGGGGNGGVGYYHTPAGAGTPNTGGGGGGGFKGFYSADKESDFAAGGTGGSGIAIFRWNNTQSV